MNPRIETLRQQLAQLRALHGSGTPSEQALAEARDLERAMVEAVMADAARPPTAPSRKLSAGLLLAVVGLAVAGYALTGSPGRAGPGPGLPSATSTVPAVAAAGTEAVAAPPNDAQVADIVERMAQRLKDRPDDAAGWALLARAYAALGRHTEAVPAFRKAVALSGDDAGLLADLADTLAAQNDGKFDAEAVRLIERASARDPDNPKAQALAGSVAFDRRDYAAAVRHWQQAERRLAADSMILPQLRASLAQARELGGLPAAAAGERPKP